MSDLPHWAIPFRNLGDEYRAAQGKYPHCHILLSVPRFRGDDRFHECTCCEDWNIKRDGYTSNPPLFGISEHVKEFRRLATMSGAALPIDFKPNPALYPLSDESGPTIPESFRNNHDEHGRVSAWCEFLMIALPEQFVFTPPISPDILYPSLPECARPPANNHRCCRLSAKVDPFSLSVMAIDGFLLTEDIDNALCRFQQTKRFLEAATMGLPIPVESPPPEPAPAALSPPADTHGKGFDPGPVPKPAVAESPDLAAKLGSLTPALSLAYRHYLAAVAHVGEGATWKSLHDWCIADSRDVGTIESFKKNVNRALDKLGLPKHSVRGGSAPRSAAPVEHFGDRDRKPNY